MNVDDKEWPLDEQLIQIEPPEDKERDLSKLPGLEILAGSDGGSYSMQASNKAILLLLVSLAIIVAVSMKKFKYLQKVVEYVPESGIIMFLGAFVTLINYLFGWNFEVTIYG